MTAEEMWNQSGLTGEYDAWSFGDDADTLARLVKDGIKTATCSAYCFYELEEEEAYMEQLLAQYKRQYSDYEVKLAKANRGSEKPTMVILNTRKGCGVKWIEELGPGNHNCPISEEQAAAAIREIRGED